MAKKATVTVSDLAEETGMEGRKIRMVIRGLGMKAPAIEGQEGFGPRAKYEWKEGDKDLKKIRKAIEDAKAAEKEHGTKEKKTKKKGKSKKSKKEEVAEEDEEDEEDEVDEDDKDDDEDDDEDDEDDE